MPRIVECVPNFSEGRDKKVVEAIADAIRCVSGVRLLDVDPGSSTNRTVYTFVGGPEDIVEGALAAARVAYHMIDMTTHKGEHPRMGALDVCPFIPVSEITEEECVEISKAFGRRLSEELNVPVFLYGAASDTPYRKTMPQIRAGEYEGLKMKLTDSAWKPDFGPAEFRPKWGGTVTGVRKFLIAYNVNMLSTKEQAHRIALNLREQGRGPSAPGRLKAVQGIGWYLQEQDLAQISFNLTDYHATPIHVAFEEAKKDAEKLNLAVSGSEIVGLVPLESILMAADFYIKKENLFILEESQKVLLAINRLGLSTLSPFNPKERIIEYCLEKPSGQLTGLTVEAFVKSVRARTPAPGGGSVAALVASLGSALGAMVCQLSYGKRQWDHLDKQMRRLIPALHDASGHLLSLVDDDTDAFTAVMVATKLPKSTEEEIAARERALQLANQRSVEVPLQVMKAIAGLWEPLQEAALVGNFNCKSDIQMGAKCLENGAFGAYYNVSINLESSPDQNKNNEILEQAKLLLRISELGCQKTLQLIQDRKE